MGDLVFVAVMVAFSALLVLYVKACERIVGTHTTLPPTGDTAAAADDGAMPVGSTQGGTA